MDQEARRTDLPDILDRVLDKGIVIEAGIRIAVAGIDLISVDVSITVASIETYLQLAEDPRAYELGLVGGRRRRSTEEELEQLMDEKESGRAEEEGSAAGAGTGAPAPADPGLPLAAFHDEELSTSPPEETEPGEQE